jgi:hypothetical protein
MGTVTDKPKGRQRKLVRDEIGYTIRVPQRGEQTACGSRARAQTHTYTYTHTHTHTHKTLVLITQVSARKQYSGGSHAHKVDSDILHEADS